MVVLWIVVVALITVGLIGIVVPFLPGIALVFAGIAVYAVGSDFAVISPWMLALYAAVALLAWLAEYASSAVGARLGGGGRLAGALAVVGGLGGLLFSPAGVLIGAFLGALTGALLEGRQGAAAFRIAAVSVIAIIGSKVLQLVIALSMIVAFSAHIIVS